MLQRQRKQRRCDIRREPSRPRIRHLCQPIRRPQRLPTRRSLHNQYMRRTIRRVNHKTTRQLHTHQRHHPPVDVPRLPREITLQRERAEREHQEGRGLCECPPCTKFANNPTCKEDLQEGVDGPPGEHDQTYLVWGEAEATDGNRGGVHEWLKDLVGRAGEGNEAVVQDNEYESTIGDLLECRCPG